MTPRGESPSTIQARNAFRTATVGHCDVDEPHTPTPLSEPTTSRNAVDTAQSSSPHCESSIRDPRENPTWKDHDDRSSPPLGRGTVGPEHRPTRRCAHHIARRPRTAARQPRRLLRPHCVYFRGNRLRGGTRQHLAFPLHRLRERRRGVHDPLPDRASHRGHPTPVRGLRDRTPLA